MSSLAKETVTEVHHWTDTLFSFKTTRAAGFRFRNGHFTMMGLPQENGRPLLRAYSLASANYEDELEFFSTGKNLWLLSTGTGLAPFLSIIKDPEVYESFDKVILTHGVRYKTELAYQQMIEKELPENEFFGDLVKEKLLYYPTVTREAFKNTGRLTDKIRSGELTNDLGLPELNVESDRFMICGSPAMLKETCEILDSIGFSETRNGHVGEYVIERAFVEQD